MKTLLAIAFLALSSFALADDVNVGWTPNAETNIDHYRIEWGSQPDTFDQSADVPFDQIKTDINGEKLVFTTLDLPKDSITYIRVIAANDQGLESLPSEILIYGPPAKPAFPVLIRINADGSVEVL